MSRDYSSSSHSHPPPLPMHLCFFLLILLMFVSLSWYSTYESAVMGFFDQIKFVLMVSPLLLLLALHVVSTWRSWFFMGPTERESLHRAGGTPWGVGFLLVFLFFMISYQSSFQERWFPLLSRS
ncbi:Splicing factor, arginine/serine-rich [Actinidia chinensis var. chinensis]|uniref:Splicing factor, arginine/serine-rich n=1 Tax=Actinidia chinensis var. chinensis TaxID=1590841 RepID=A0A2R6QKW6_ACTCC|nr:uncharacterized protein LOC130794400 [Actinidia eriantha]PSS10039.1 Splicing factor, arginine/serine-rich [Actinidia chinensis var. chinensis]